MLGRMALGEYEVTKSWLSLEWFPVDGYRMSNASRYVQTISLYF